jgi:hypothetical protein
VNPLDPDTMKADDGEHVSPQRAAQRLYDEMALAYAQQADDDLKLNRELLPAAASPSHDADA